MTKTSNCAIVKYGQVVQTDNLFEPRKLLAAVPSECRQTLANLIGLAKTQGSIKGSGFLRRFLHHLCSGSQFESLLFAADDQLDRNRLLSVLNFFRESNDYSYLASSPEIDLRGESLCQEAREDSKEFKPSELLFFALLNPTLLLVKDRPHPFHRKLVTFLVLKLLSEDMESGNFNLGFERSNDLCKELRLTFEAAPGTKKAELREVLLSTAILNDKHSYADLKYSLLRYIGDVESTPRRVDKRLLSALVEKFEKAIDSLELDNSSNPSARLSRTLTSKSALFPELDQELEEDTLAIVSGPLKDSEPKVQLIDQSDYADVKLCMSIRISQSKLRVAPFLGNKLQAKFSDNPWLSSMQIEADTPFENAKKLTAFLASSFDLSLKESAAALLGVENSLVAIDDERLFAWYERSPKVDEFKVNPLLYPSTNQFQIKLPFRAPTFKQLPFATPELDKAASLLANETLIACGIAESQIRALKRFEYLEVTLDPVSTNLKYSHPLTVHSPMHNYFAGTNDCPSANTETEAVNAIGSPYLIRLDELREIVNGDIHQVAQLNVNDEWLERWNLITKCTLRVLAICTGCRGTDELFDELTDFNLDANWVYVEDKVVDETYPGRVIPLPNIASSLVRHYVQMLARLARVAKFDPDPCEDDRSLADRFLDNHQLPFFFLLSRKSSSTILARSVLAREINPAPSYLPSNWNRHLFSTEMIEFLDREIIEYIKGNSDNDISPFGTDSLGNLEESFKEARIQIEKFLLEILKIDVSLISMAMDEQKFFESIELISKQEPFGKERRCINRVKQRQTIAAIKRITVSRFAAKFAKSKLTEEETTQLVSEVETYFEKEANKLGVKDIELDEARASTLQILLRTSPKKLRLRKIRNHSIENAPLQKSFLTFDQRDKCIENLLSFISKAPPKNSVSALIEAILRVIYIHRRTSTDLIQRIKNLDFECRSVGKWNLLICRTDQRQLRCEHIVILDARTATCLKVALKSKRKLAGWLDQSSFLQALKEALNQASLLHISTPNQLIDFTRITQLDKNRFTLPLSLSRLLSDEIQHQEMGLGSLIPLLCEGYQLNYSTTSVKATKKAPKIRLRERDLAASDQSESYSFETDRKGLRKALTECTSNQRAKLRQCITRFTSTSKSFSIFSQWLTLRLEKLPSHGSKDNVKLSSLLAIYDKGVAPLAYVVGISDPAHSSAEIIEECLLDYFSIGTKTTNTFHHEVNRLNDFFKFASLNHNWPTIVIPATFETLHSDKIISQHEYLLMLKHSEKYPLKIRRIIKAILILSFKFGLRIGEIFNLRKMDIVLAALCPVVLIRSRKGATVKYSSSIRDAIPSLSLERQEREVLEHLITLPASYAAGKRLLDSSLLTEAYKQCNSLIKQIAGRGSIHTLRHACAHYWISKSWDSAISREANTEVLNKISAGQRRHYSLFAIGSIMGHSSFSKVTLPNYFHGLALVNLPECSEAEFEEFTLSKLSFEEDEFTSRPTSVAELAETLAEITLGAMSDNNTRVAHWLEALPSLERKNVLERIARLSGNKNQAGSLKSERLRNLKSNGKAEQLCVQLSVKNFSRMYQASKITNPLNFLSTRSTLVINEHNAEELELFLESLGSEAVDEMIGAVRIIESKEFSEGLHDRFRKYFPSPLKPQRLIKHPNAKKPPKQKAESQSHTPRGGYGQFFTPPETTEQELRLESQNSRKLLFTLHFIDFLNLIKFDLEEFT